MTISSYASTPITTSYEFMKEFLDNSLYNQTGKISSEEYIHSLSSGHVIKVNVREPYYDKFDDKYIYVVLASVTNRFGNECVSVFIFDVKVENKLEYYTHTECINKVIELLS